MGFDSLLDTLHDNDAYLARMRSTQPTTCPNDGTILETDSHGRLRCPWGDWVWDGSNHPDHNL